MQKIFYSSRKYYQNCGTYNDKNTRINIGNDNSFRETSDAVRYLALARRAPRCKQNANDTEVEFYRYYYRRCLSTGRKAATRRVDPVLVSCRIHTNIRFRNEQHFFLILKFCRLIKTLYEL